MENINNLIKQANNYYSKGDFKSALAIFYQILAINLDDYANYHNVGLMYDLLEEKELAISYYKKALRLNSNDVRSVNNIAKIYLDFVHDEKGAMEYLDYAIKIAPKDAEAYNAYGQIHFGRNEFDKAILYYKKAMHFDDKYYKNYYDISKAYFENNNKEEAITAIKKCLELNPDFKPAKDFLDKIN